MVGEFPDHDIVRTHGIVYGETVRGLRARVEFKSNRKKRGNDSANSVEIINKIALFGAVREEAISRMVEGIKATGGNAACGVRFDTEVGRDGEILACCLATAESVVPRNKT